MSQGNSTVGQGLNPFEVREVLQVEAGENQTINLVSIPLKSGRCCKDHLLAMLSIFPSQSL